MTESSEVRWAIDYSDGTGPHEALDEFSARAWARHYNAHREDRPAAAVVRRTVTVSAWERVDA